MCYKCMEKILQNWLPSSSPPLLQCLAHEPQVRARCTRGGGRCFHFSLVDFQYIGDFLGRKICKCHESLCSKGGWMSIPTKEVKTRCRCHMPKGKVFRGHKGEEVWHGDWLCQSFFSPSNSCGPDFVGFPHKVGETLGRGHIFEENNSPL